MTRKLSVWHFALSSLRFFTRSHFAVGLGVGAATAVIVGALVVGDSVRASLRGLVLDRLGNIECLLHAQTFFATEMLPGQNTQNDGPDAGPRVVPLILLRSASVERRTADELRRAAGVQVLGTADDFWQHIQSPNLPASDGPLSIGEDQVILNASLASDLNAAVGDEITLRLPSVSGVPADNPLGRREDTSVSLPRQEIIAILPDASVASVTFQASQDVPRNVFCARSTLQDLLETGSRVNAAVSLSPSHNAVAQQGSPENVCQELDSRVRPALEDFGLQFERVTRRFPSAAIAADSSPATLDTPERNARGDDDASGQVIYDYYQISSRELLIPSQFSNAISARYPNAIQLQSYLANAIAKIELIPSEDMPHISTFGPSRTPSLASLARPVRLTSREVPYSIVVGIEGESYLGLDPWMALPEDQLRMPYCWINSWLADELQAEPGDWIQMRYFEPETVDGSERERLARFMVAGIVPLTPPEQGFQRGRQPRYTQAPTLYNDPQLTPNVPGLTDKDSISNWDAPFKLETELILSQDDAYYNDHRLTPKVFIPHRFTSSSLMFGSRFGSTTAFRFPVADYPDQTKLRSEIEAALTAVRDTKGLNFQDLRSNLLRSAAGTTPFDMLFLSLSIFVIVAALMLVALLFKLGIGQRASQLGLLAAQGFSVGRIRGLLLRELTLVILAGAVVGLGLGLLYARMMIAALESWWIGAISSPFIHFSFTWQSLAIGGIAGVVISLATIYGAIRSLSGQAPLALLRGQTGEARTTLSGRPNRLMLSIAGFVAIGAVGLIVAGVGQSGMARAGSFFGSGMLLLAAALIAVRQLLVADVLREKSGARGNLGTLAMRAICRNPLRSSLALGLLAVASFLIASMGAFHVSTSARGYGGFNLLGQTSLPIYRNLSSSDMRQEVLGNDADKLRNTTILPLRLQPGADASCNNMFQVAQPAVLGVPKRLAELHDFSADAVRFDWVDSVNRQNPWLPLRAAATGSDVSPIPVIVDQNTAAWSLKQGASLDSIIRLEYGGRIVSFRTVGLLTNSVLQGKLLIGEDNFRQLFPEINGYQFFMISTPSDVPEEVVAEALEQGWGDQGMDVTSSRQTLDRLLAVQNTYISAFQLLGALGLLLGTFGLAAVQLRSVVERRRELALLQAVGFVEPRIGRMLAIETAILLGGGLLIGMAAAAIALTPYVVENGAQINVLQPLGLLLGVMLVGFLVALMAVRSALRGSVVAALRDE